MDIIQRDIIGLGNAAQERRQNIKQLRQGIKDLLREQEELKFLLSQDSEYDKEALEKNIVRIAFNISRVEDTIAKEEAGIKQLSQMVEVLERKQCLSGTILL